MRSLARYISHSQGGGWVGLKIRLLKQLYYLIQKLPLTICLGKVIHKFNQCLYAL